MARVTLTTDTSDAAALIEVICATAATWPQARRDAFTVEFDRLVDRNLLCSVQIGGPGRIEVDASPELMALARRYGIGEVMA